MPLRVSYNQIKIWNQCRRKWWFTHSAKLNTTKQTHHLTFGKVWGMVCDALWIKWVQEGTPPRPDSVEGIIDSVFRPLIAIHEGRFSLSAYDDDGNTAECWPTLNETLDNRRHMHWLCRWYINTWARVGFEPTELITEFPISVPLVNGGGDRLYVGYVDKLVMSRGRWVVIDHKSTGMDFDRWLVTHEHDSQTTLYAAALERLGYDVSHTVWDIVSNKPQPRLDDFKLIKSGKRLSRVLPSGATHGMLLKAIKHHGFDPDDYKDQLETLKLKRPEYSHIEFMPVDETEKLRIWHELIGYAGQIADTPGSRVRELVAAAHESGDLDMVVANLTCDPYTLRNYPRNTESCFSYSRPCKFSDACHRFNTANLEPSSYRGENNSRRVVTGGEVEIYEREDAESK